METVTLACNAMATRFELVLQGPRASSLRAAGEEAIRELEMLEARLSLFRETSEIARANALASRQPVRLSPEVFALVQLCARLSEETKGAFDVTIAPLLRAWGFLGGRGAWPSVEGLGRAREVTGMHLVHLDPDEHTVFFEREGVMLDLGAIGKGHAVDAMVDILREAGVERGLVHGGTSSVYGIGTPIGAAGWKVVVDPPRLAGPGSNRGGLGTGAAEGNPLPPGEGLSLVELKDSALAVSAVSGKCFEHEGRVYGHLLDPRTGSPANSVLISVLALPSAAEADGLSTALLVGGAAQFAALSDLRPGMKCLVAFMEGGLLRCVSKGLEVQATQLSAMRAA